MKPEVYEVFKFALRCAGAALHAIANGIERIPRVLELADKGWALENRAEARRFACEMGAIRAEKTQKRRRSKRRAR